MPRAWCHVLANTDDIVKSAYTYIILLHICHGSSRNCPAVSSTNDYVLIKTAKIEAEGTCSPGRPRSTAPDQASLHPHLLPADPTRSPAAARTRLSCIICLVLPLRASVPLSKNRTHAFFSPHKIKAKKLSGIY